MDILIISCFIPSFGDPDKSRFLYLAELLSREHQVELLTTTFDHDTKMRDSGLGAPRIFPFQVTQLFEPGYPKNVCLRRFSSHHAWGKNVEKYLRERKKPDVIYCAVPSLTGPLAAANYCRENGVRFVIDVQDLWPEAFEMIVNIPVLSDIAFAPFRAMADRIYSSADTVCAVSQTYVDRALKVNRKHAAGVPVFLGTRLETFDGYAAAHAVTDKPEDALWLGYCGTLGASYDLTCVFDAMALLRGQGKPLPAFIVMGDGPRKAEFEEYARKLSLPVRFLGLLPYPTMCGVLQACDMVVNPIVGRSAASIINKHADYAACGRPVLNTQNSPEYRRLVETYEMGFNCASGDAAALADKISRLMAEPALRLRMGANARRCAEERFDRQNSYQALVKAITEA